MHPFPLRHEISIYFGIAVFLLHGPGVSLLLLLYVFPLPTLLSSRLNQIWNGIIGSLSIFLKYPPHSTRVFTQSNLPVKARSVATIKVVHGFYFKLPNFSDTASTINQYLEPDSRAWQVSDRTTFFCFFTTKDLVYKAQHRRQIKKEEEKEEVYRRSKPERPPSFAWTGVLSILANWRLIWCSKGSRNQPIVRFIL